MKHPFLPKFKRGFSVARLALCAVVLLSGCSTTSSQNITKSSFQQCHAYLSQEKAQQAWKDAGRPAFADRDHDGLVCERMANTTLTKHFASHGRHGGHAKTTGCARQKQPVSVVIDPREYPYTARHVEESKRAGEAEILHINRPAADRHRDHSLAGIPTKKGFDRDEYPPAMSREGGEGANVKYVPSKDNRGSGRIMGIQLGKYCDGQAFRLITTERKQ